MRKSSKNLLFWREILPFCGLDKRERLLAHSTLRLQLKMASHAEQKQMSGQAGPEEERGDRIAMLMPSIKCPSPPPIVLTRAAKRTRSQLDASPKSPYDHNSSAVAKASSVCESVATAANTVSDVQSGGFDDEYQPHNTASPVASDTDNISRVAAMTREKETERRRKVKAQKMASDWKTTAEERQTEIQQQRERIHDQQLTIEKQAREIIALKLQLKQLQDATPPEVAESIIAPSTSSVVSPSLLLAQTPVKPQHNSQTSSFQLRPILPKPSSSSPDDLWGHSSLWGHSVSGPMPLHRQRNVLSSFSHPSDTSRASVHQASLANTASRSFVSSASSASSSSAMPSPSLLTSSSVKVPQSLSTTPCSSSFAFTQLPGSSNAPVFQTTPPNHIPCQSIPSSTLSTSSSSLSLASSSISSFSSSPSSLFCAPPTSSLLPADSAPIPCTRLPQLPATPTLSTYSSLCPTSSPVSLPFFHA